MPLARQARGLGVENNIGWWLAKRAFLTPMREGYVGDDGSRLTFAELNARCNQVANAFAAAGVGKGERVGLLLMNGAEFLEAYFALAKIGAVVVPLNSYIHTYTCILQCNPASVGLAQARPKHIFQI